MKRIAIFADGTWNSPEQGRATNVLRMARAVSIDENREDFAPYSGATNPMSMSARCGLPARTAMWVGEFTARAAS